MDTRWTLLALLRLWPEMPTLLGAAWREEFPRYRDLLRQVEGCEDDGKRDWLLADLAELLAEHDEVRKRFSEVRSALSQGNDERGNGKPAPPPPGWEELRSGIDLSLDPPAVTRYTDIEAPRRLTRGSRGAVIARLTRQQDPESLEVQPLKLGLAEKVEVHCHASPEAFEILGSAVALLSVEPEADSPPVVFYVKALREGTATVRLDFRQSGQLAGTAAVEIEVVSGETAADLRSVAAGVTLGGPYVPPPDLEIRVVWDAVVNPRELRFILHSPNGTAPYTFLPSGSLALPYPMEEFHKKLLIRIEDVTRHTGKDGHLSPREVQERLIVLGRNLYGELFPEAMRREYRHFRGRVKTVLIYSDEPWIPWEMIKPYDDEGEDVVDDEFLCLQFQVTRWLTGRSAAPCGEIRVSRLVCVDDPSLSREGGRGERAFFARLAAENPGLADLSPRPASLGQVKDLLDRGGIDLWHFATHGDADRWRIDDAAVELEGGALKAGDLQGPRATQISRDRPLVFMNACRVARQGWSLTRLGGWATAWVTRCRCGLFIGPLWEVTNSLAEMMATTFYQALRDGKTVGEAAHVARRRVFDAAAQDLTWLAYSVYAHPNALVLLPAHHAAPPLGEPAPVNRGE